MLETPPVSAVMSVFNGEAILAQSLESILNQSLRDFELILINDGSTDRTAEVLSKYNDPRIHLIENRENIGLTPSLDIGLKAARGKWIARCDADDWNDPRRFERQLEFAESNQLDLCFCDWTRQFEDGSTSIQRDSSMSEVRHRWHSLFRNAWGAHPAALFNREKILALGGYDESFRTTQDYDLWNRCADAGLRFGWMPEVLLRRPDSQQTISVRLSGVQLQAKARINRANFDRILPNLDDDEIWQIVWLLEGDSTTPPGKSLRRGLQLAPQFIRQYLSNNPAAPRAEIWACVAESLHWRIHKLSGLWDRLTTSRLFCLAVLRARGKYRFPLGASLRRFSGARR